MDDDQQFCLRWNNHQSTLISVFDTLLENETLVDCTLAAEGRFMKAHKVVLSACSPYFATLLQQQYDKHPIFILKDVKYQELRAMMDYMYRGEVNISQDQLAALLKAAESLQIKGLSDNRSGSGAGSAPRQEIPHQRASIPGGKHGYTLEQTKRARLGPGSGIEQQEIVSGSREGSSSPSRRRRKPRRRSIDNDVHDNSNSSANQQPNASLAGSAITASALASQMTAAAAAAAAASAVVSPAALASAVVSSQQQSGTQQQQAQLTTNVPKKTETIKGTTSDAMNNENIQATTSGTAIVGSGAAGVVIGSGAATATGGDEQDIADKVEQKSNHKQKSSNIGKDASTIPSGELTIEPKSEYDDEGNDENVEDLTLDEEEMGMDDLDHNAGTSQGGEGSSQGYAAWQHDNRSQDELLLTTQDAQQRDPQGFHIATPSTTNTTSTSTAVDVAGSSFSSITSATLNHTSNNHNMPQQSQYHNNNNNNSNISASTLPPYTSNSSKPRSVALYSGTTCSSNSIAAFPSNFHSIASDSSVNTTTSNNNNGSSHNLYNLRNDEETFTCPQCNRTYRRHGTLRRHLRQECGKGKSMVCSVCGHRTKRADHLRQHVRKKHPEIAMRSLFRRGSGAQSHQSECETSPNTTNSILQQQLQNKSCFSNAMHYSAATTSTAITMSPEVVELADDDDDEDDADLDDFVNDSFADNHSSDEDEENSLLVPLTTARSAMNDKGGGSIGTYTNQSKNHNMPSASSSLTVSASTLKMNLIQHQLHQQALKHIQQQMQRQQQQQQHMQQHARDNTYDDSTVLLDDSNNSTDDAQRQEPATKPTPTLSICADDIN